MKSVQILWHLPILLAPLAGCMNIAPSGNIPGEKVPEKVHFLRQKEISGSQMESQLEGKLVLSEGCLQIQVNSEEAYTTIWKNEFAYRKQGNDISVLNADGQAVARVGDQILVSGGEEASLSREEFADNYLGTYQCAEPYWIVGYEVSVLTP